MHSTAYFGAFITAVFVLQVNSAGTVIGLYGQTIEVPCNGGENKPDGLIFTKWKYEKDGGTPGDLLIKQAQKDEATITATDGYQDRVSITANSSLLIAQGTLADQRVFTCMVVSMSNLAEYPVEVVVHKKPSPPQIKDKIKELENGKLTTLGECVAQDANPAATLIWSKNGQPLVDDGKTTVITSAVTKDPATGLSSTSSRLQYAAGKGDVNSRFACTASHALGPDQTSAPETFSVRYPTEKVTLQVVNEGTIEEGDNLTLRCQADGSPPPTSYNFYAQGKKVTVTNSDTYSVPGVTRRHSGEYKCALIDNDAMEGTANVVVSYLDLSLSPLGNVLKKFGDTLVVTVEKNASADAKVSWTKDNGTLEKLPRFHKLTYADAGSYVCEVSVAGIKRSLSFQLAVEGTPRITRLEKQRSTDGKHKVLICEVEGSPQPSVQWSVNGTNEESSYSNGKATHRITVVPSSNLTVTCAVSNDLGADAMSIEVSSIFEEEKQKQKDDDKPDEGGDQAKVIVGVVVGLIVAAAVGGAIYWLYMKKSKQGTWNTGEKEAGTSEESKKLEENNHKADV